MLLLSRRLRPLDQLISDFRAAELHRRALAGAKHVSHLCAAEEDLGLRAVRAGLLADHSLAHLAPGAVLELERRDADLFRDVELIENLLGIVRAVVIAHARVIAADDEMRHAV